MCQNTLIVIILNIIISIDWRNSFEIHNQRHLQIGQSSQRTQYCFDEIGCLNNSEIWHDKILRPVNLKPLDRHTIHTSFILLSLNTSDNNILDYDIIIVKKDSLGIFEACIQRNKTIFLIHDFTSNGNTGWIKHFAKALLKKENTNVIAVDWEAGAEPPYDQAIANARVVALEIAAMLKLLQVKYSRSMENIHIFGHGVGAHIAGYVGKMVKGIGIITAYNSSFVNALALDPSGPRFFGMPSEVRLDESDAHFVEALHTDTFGAKSQGTTSPMGHVDFFINGEKLQPGCNESSFSSVVKLSRNDIKEGSILPDCSHKRAFKYYLEAIRNANGCEFIGFEAHSFDQFISGAINYCENEWDCAKFGNLEAPPSKPPHNKSYYLLTNGQFPFCIHPTKITIYLDNNPRASKSTKGFFDFIFVTRNGKMVNSTTNNFKKKLEYENGKCYTLLNYAAPTNIREIAEARVKWIRNSICLFCNNAIYVQSFYVHSINLKEDRTETTENFIHMCPKDGTKLPDKVYVEFQPCADQADERNETSTTATSTQASSRGTEKC